MVKLQFLTLTTFLSALLTNPIYAEEGSFDSDGVKIHYIVEGKGEPVVLIHGFAADIQTNWGWPGVLKALAKDYQVIALDLRGHGRSGKPHEAKLYGKNMAEDVVRLLDHLKIKRAHIVGYSMGGGIALELLMHHPDRILTATIGGFGISTAQREKDMVNELADSLAQGKGFGPLLRAITPPGQAKPTDEQIKFSNTMLLAFNDAKALAACMRGFKEETDLDAKDIIKDLKKGNRPILAIVGENDPFKPGVDELKKEVPDTELVVVKNGDHVSTMMSPEFLKSVQKFLREYKRERREK